jgi:bacterioferritin
VKPSDIVAMLQVDLADELASITQYMYHHIMVIGRDEPTISGLFRSTAIDEMRHAERLAERITQLGAVPTPKPGEIKTGGDLLTMVRQDLTGETAAIKTYRAQVKKVGDNDPITRRLLEDLLVDENAHAKEWKTVLGE